MTSLVHLVPRLWLGATAGVGHDRGVVRPGRQLLVALATVAGVACLVAAAILLFAAFAGIDTAGRVPHPVPLPAPTGKSLAGN